MTTVLERLERDFAYNAWANGETLKSAQAAGRLPARAGAVLAHIAAAEWLWLRRLGQSAPALDVWPPLTPDECASQFRDLSRAWPTYLVKLGPESLATQICYTNTKGEGWSNTVEDVLTHVVLHSAYHRGQIATLLRESGATPAYTDYIECVRRGHMKGHGPD